MNVVCDGPTCSSEIHGDPAYELLKGREVIVDMGNAQIDVGSSKGLFCSLECLREAIEEDVIQDEEKEQNSEEGGTAD